MAYTITVMAYGLCSYGPYSYGLYNYGLYSYGIYGYGLHGYGIYGYGVHRYGLYSSGIYSLESNRVSSPPWNRACAFNAFDLEGYSAAILPDWYIVPVSFQAGI